MTRILRSFRFILALSTVIIGLGAFASTPDGAAAASSGGFTPLPPGWELCILQGLSAPTTGANVADLDEWQAAEGGSTNNTAAFNPYNTLRMTDTTGARLPGATSSNGFPAFPTWAAGCAATVATLFQSNMWVITAALRAGNVSPPAAFLAVVDQSAWCAPSADGEPCYVDAMESTPGSLALAVPASSALSVYGNVNSDLQSYQQSVATVFADQNEVAARNGALDAAGSSVDAAQARFAVASRALREFAVNEYVSTGLYSGAPLVDDTSTEGLGLNTPPSAEGVVAQQYIHLTAAELVDKSEGAASAVKKAQQRREAAASALAAASITLTSDETAEDRGLLQLTTDLANLQHAGACATVTIAPPQTTASGSSDSTTTTTTTTTPPSTTIPTPSAPPAATSTTTTGPPGSPTTTTTTDPTASSTTTTSSPNTTTTTTAPTTTTTTATTVPSPTTTTTTIPSPADSSSGAASPAVSAGISALAGCVATFAPSASA
jgi:hypothetical protein